MKKILTVILALGLIASFAACNDNSVQSGDNQNQQQNNGQQNNAEGTVISLEGNATTGYTWNASSYDINIIRIEDLGGEALNQESGEGLVGAPSVYKFKVVGLKEGITDLRFDYYRVWDGSESAIETKEYLVTVDELLNVTVEEKVEVEEPSEDDFLVSAEMETLLNDLISKSEVQFPMAASSKIILANAPTFVGLSEELFKANVVDSVVYEPMISPAQHSLCIVQMSEEADVATLKQTVLDNSNPAKWICTGAEKCLVIESGRYIMLVMSTPENCEALKNAFTEHFGAENVGEALTKDGLANEMPEDEMGGGMAL